MGGSTSSSPLLEPCTQISTGFECDNCHIIIDRIAWKRCKICKIFDLCHQCEKFKHGELLLATRDNHKMFHHFVNKDESITSECMVSVAIEKAEEDGKKNRDQMIQLALDESMRINKIINDSHMHHVMIKLNQIQNELGSSPGNILRTKSENDLLSESKEAQRSQLSSMIAEYQMQGSATNIRILSLDGGGVRGYMPIQVLLQLITEEHLDGNQLDYTKPENEAKFKEAQKKFTDQFDYFVGTSTGGLIAFCLAAKYNIAQLKKIYENFSYYFKRNWLGPYIWAKYDPCHIHDEIHKIIRTIQLKDGTFLSPEHATLLDMHNYLNDDVVNESNLEQDIQSHGNMLEFVDHGSLILGIKREKVLLITAYNGSANSMTVFNTSYAEHWEYRIADVLKATMAAPTFFKPQTIYRGIKENGEFKPYGTPEVFIDGGVFANDPEVAALWAIRMQWKKPVTYHIMSIGTGCYSAALSPSSWGGYAQWLANGGLVVNTLMDATRSLTEVVMNNLARFDNIKRIKFNYKILKPMSLDDGDFLNQFNHEWASLQYKEDFRALLYFYKKFFKTKQN